MEGNAKIIKFICLDENVHLVSTQAMLKLPPKDDKDFAKIAKETNHNVKKCLLKQLSKLSHNHLFKDGSMIGLNAQLLKDYVEWTAHKRMLSVGLTSPTRAEVIHLGHKTGPSGAEVQVVPPRNRNIQVMLLAVLNKTLILKHSKDLVYDRNIKPKEPIVSKQNNFVKQEDINLYKQLGVDFSQEKM